MRASTDLQFRPEKLLDLYPKNDGTRAASVHPCHMSGTRVEVHIFGHVIARATVLWPTRLEPTLYILVHFAVTYYSSMGHD